MEEYQAIIYKIWAELDAKNVRKVDGLHIDIKNPNSIWANEKWINATAARQCMEEGMNSEEFKSAFECLDGEAKLSVYKLKEGDVVFPNKMDNMSFEEYMEWVKTTDPDQPYGITWTVQIKEGMMEEYLAAISKIRADVDAKNVREVDGLHIDIKNPNIVWCNEKWSSAGAAKKLMEEGMNSEEWKKCFECVEGVAQMSLYKLKN